MCFNPYHYDQVVRDAAQRMQGVTLHAAPSATDEDPLPRPSWWSRAIRFVRQAAVARGTAWTH